MNRFACIYIGPNLIEVISAQRGQGRKAQILERAYQDTELGDEIYSTGIIGPQTAKHLYKLLKGYIRLAGESDPEEIRLIFSREMTLARNFIFVYARIKELYPECTFKILTDDDEMSLFCLSAGLYLSEGEDVREGNMMMASFTAQGIDFALTGDGIIDYTEEIPYGYLKLTELVETITRERTHYSKLLSEIIQNKLRLAISHIGGRDVDRVALMTKDARVLAKIYPNKQDGQLYYFERETIENAYKDLKELTPEQIRSLHPELTESQSLTIQSTILVARQMIHTADVDRIILIQRDIAYATVQFEFKATLTKALRNWLIDGAKASAYAVARRYGVDLEHVKNVENYALRIFDTLKKSYKLSKRERLLLILACRLLDVGQFGGEEGQARAAEEIVRREQIVGLSAAEEVILSRVCWGVKTNSYEKTREGTLDLSFEDQLTVFRIMAILKIATSIDQSRRGKVDKISCSLGEDELVVSVTTSHNTQLESYYFNRDSIWMERVFELRPVLKVKRRKKT